MSFSNVSKKNISPCLLSINPDLCNDNNNHKNRMETFLFFFFKMYN